MNTTFAAYKDRYLDEVNAFWERHRYISYVFLAIGAIGLLFSLFAFVFIMMVRLGAYDEIPSRTDLRSIQNFTASEVYSSDGKLMGKFYVENRINIDYDDISENIVNALVATEDARFYDHDGVDLRSMFRVAIKSILLSDESSGGGSTISQQVVKNIYGRPDHGALTLPVSKLREMIVARRLEKIYTKPEIINLYLNTVPFSENIYGIRVAAERFYNKSAKDLTVEEAATLIGSLKATTSYNPRIYPNRSAVRRNTIINLMRNNGYIDAAQADSLKRVPIMLAYSRESNNDGIGTYIREHIRTQLEDILKDYRRPDGRPYDPYTDGLKIYTTIDSRMQTMAEESVAEHMKELQADFDKHWKGSKPWKSEDFILKAMRQSERYRVLKDMGWVEDSIIKNFNKPVPTMVFTYDGEKELRMSPMDSIRYYKMFLNNGFIVMEPQTGFIRAWVGGVNHKYFKFDHTQARRQVGSTFKPIVYAAALKHGHEPCDPLYNHLVTYTEYDNWRPENADDRYGGLYSMQGGITKSVNAVAVDMIMRVGPKKAAAFAKELGITSEVPAYPAIALGSPDIKLFDMMKVFGTFANRGLRPEPMYITRIETADGKVLREFEYSDASKMERVLEQDKADMIRIMLESVVDNGTGRRLRYRYKLKNDLAGKTGTTNNHADGWFMGFTPNLVGGVWTGASDPSIYFRSIALGQGANMALPVWGNFLTRLYAHPDFAEMAEYEFPEPSPEVVEAMDCPMIRSEYVQIDSSKLEGGSNFIDRTRDKVESILRPNRDRADNSSPSSGNSEQTESRREERKEKRRGFFKRIFGNKDEPDDE